MKINKNMASINTVVKNPPALGPMSPMGKRPFSLEVGTLSLFIAMSKSGKSFLQRYLLRQLMSTKSFKWVYVITPTKFNREWSNVVGDSNVAEEFDEEVIEDLLDHLADMAHKGKQYPGLLILDDCMGSIDFQSKLITKLASTGRHFAGLTIWATFQYYYKVPTVMRENAAYLVMLNQVNVKVAKTILEEKANLEFDSAKDLKDHFKQETDNFGAVVIQTHDRNRPILTIRAPYPEKKFKLNLKKPKGT